MTTIISKRLRQRVLAAHSRCVYCGMDFGERRSERATVDHVVPLAQGGATVIDNLTACCRYCNRAKRDRTPQEWAADILAADTLAAARLALAAFSVT